MTKSLNLLSIAYIRVADGFWKDKEKIYRSGDCRKISISLSQQSENVFS